MKEEIDMAESEVGARAGTIEHREQKAGMKLDIQFRHQV